MNQKVEVVFFNEEDNNNIDIGESNNREREVISDQENVNNFSISCFSRKKFFKAKYNKIYLKSTMSQERIDELALLSIEKEMLNKINYDNLINNFA